MDTDTTTSDSSCESTHIRVGGVAIIVGLAIHIVLNMVLKQMPPENPTLEELRTYLVNEQDTWALVHGMRYPAMACIALFAAALYARACTPRTRGWATLGVIGVTLMLANLLITNGIETFVFLDFEVLSENEEIFTAMFSATRVLWTAEIATWSIFIFGFSAAGWCSRRLPKWLAALGFVSALFGMLSGIFVVPILTNTGPAWILLEVATLTGLLWMLGGGVYLTAHGAR